MQPRKLTAKGEYARQKAREAAAAAAANAKRKQLRGAGLPTSVVDLVAHQRAAAPPVPMQAPLDLDEAPQ